MLKIFLISSLLSFSLLSSGKIASSTPSTTSEIERNTPFQKVEQPLAVKGIITVVGLGLVGLELWWFKGSKSNSK